MFLLDKLKTHAVLTIYGYVGGVYLDMRAVKKALNEITTDGYKKLDFHFHTFGGDVIDGNLIYNFLNDFDGEVDIYIDGVAASMGSMIMLAGDRVHIVDNGFVMIHPVRGGSYGQAADLRAHAKIMDSMNESLKSRLMQKTGKPEAEVKTWLDGTDHWFDAKECLALGLVDSIIDKKVKVKPIDKTEAQNLGAEAVYHRFAALSNTLPANTNKNEIKMNKAEVIARYGLTSVTAESSEEEIYKAIDAKLAEGKAATEAAKQATKKAIEAAVDVAIEGKKIKKDARDKYITRGEALGLDELNAIFADMKVYEPISGHLKNDGSGNAGVDAETKGWDWDKFQKEDVAALEEMREKDPERFNALFKAKYGKEPAK